MSYEYYWHDDYGLVYGPQQMDAGFLHIPWKTCEAFIRHFEQGKSLRTFPNMKLDRVEACLILMKFGVKGRLR